MRAWGVMLGGFGIWAIHFLGVYLLSSIADLAPDRATLWTWVGAGFSLLCLAGLVPVFLAASAQLGRRDDVGALIGIAGRAAAVLVAVAIVWQSLPLIVTGFG